jgi:hypothetical protein
MSNGSGYTTMEEHIKTCKGCGLCQDNPADYGYGCVDKAAENAKNAVANAMIMRVEGEARRATSKHWPDAECYCRMCAPLGEATQRRINNALKMKLGQAGDQFVKVTPGDYLEVHKVREVPPSVFDIGPDPSAPPPPKEPPLHRRLGRFTLLDHTVRNDPTTAMLILAGLVVVRAEQRFDCFGIEYVAYGREFDVVPEGLIAPMYTGEIFDDRRDGVLVARSVRFVRLA